MQRFIHRHPVLLTLMLILSGYPVFLLIAQTYILARPKPETFFAYIDWRNDLEIILVTFVLLWLIGIVAIHVWRLRHRTS